MSRREPGRSGGHQRQVPVTRALHAFLSGRDLCTPRLRKALFTMAKNLLEPESQALCATDRGCRAPSSGPLGALLTAEPSLQASLLFYLTVCFLLSCGHGGTFLTGPHSDSSPLLLLKQKGWGCWTGIQVVNCTVLVPLSPAYRIRFALCLAGRLDYAWL